MLQKPRVFFYPETSKFGRFSPWLFLSFFHHAETLKVNVICFFICAKLGSVRFFFFFVLSSFDVRPSFGVIVPTIVKSHCQVSVSEWKILHDWKQFLRMKYAKEKTEERKSFVIRNVRTPSCYLVCYAIIILITMLEVA